MAGLFGLKAIKEAIEQWCAQRVAQRWNSSRVNIVGLQIDV